MLYQLLIKQPDLSLFLEVSYSKPISSGFTIQVHLTKKN